MHTTTLLALALIPTIISLLAALLYRSTCHARETHETLTPPSWRTDRAAHNIWWETLNLLEKKRINTGLWVIGSFAVAMLFLFPAQHLAQSGSIDVILVNCLMAATSAAMLITTFNSCFHGDRMLNIDFSKRCSSWN